MTHSPTAFMKGTEIWLRYNERPEPHYESYPYAFGERNFGMPTAEEWEANAKARYNDWQSSSREVKFQDQEAILDLLVGKRRQLMNNTFVNDIFKGIPLDSIAGRIEVRKVCLDKKAFDNGLQCGFAREGEECDRCQPVAVLMPEETVAEESQEDYWDLIYKVIKDSRKGDDPLAFLKDKFIVKRIEK